MIDIPAGPVTLGISPDSFGWDNEFKVHSVQVPAFAIDAYKVTNGEFLNFIREGGYANRSLWGEAEWTWIKQQNIAHPRFWRKRQSQWFYQGMFEEVPLPPNWPVYVSHAEASAYARFVGKLFLPRPSSIAPLTGRRKAWSEYIRGGRRLLMLNPATSTSTDGIRLRWTAIPGAAAHSEWRTCSATAGNGHPHFLRPSRASSLFRFIPDIPRTFLTGSIT